MKPGDFLAGRYQIEEELGRGTNGIVYRALDTREHETVAVKVLLDSFRTRRAGAALERESALLSDLSHPGLVRVRSFGAYYYSMEFVKGESFHRGIAALLASGGSERKLPVVLDVGAQLAEALAYLHDRGVVHGDLKPENVLIDLQARVRLTDFGLAERTELLEQFPPARLRGGTALYAAPERIRGEEADERSDLYSFGLLMYEACTGVHPFADSDPVQVLLNHLTRPQLPLGSYWEGVPWDLEKLVERLLEKEPEERFQSAGEALAALRRVSKSGRHGSRPPPFLGRREVLRVLEAADEPQRSAPALILVEGGEGSGKTRTLEEMGRRLARRGWCVLRGWCRSGDPSALSPWCQVMTQGLACLHKIDPERTTEVAGRWGAAFGAPACFPWVGLEHLPITEDTAADALAGMVGLLTQRWPVCVLLDDLHLAPPWSTGIVLGLLRRTWGRRVVLCASAMGDTDASHALRGVAFSERVRMHPLSLRDSFKLAEELSGGDPLNRKAVSELRLGSGGNLHTFLSGVRRLAEAGPNGPAEGQGTVTGHRGITSAPLARAEALLSEAEAALVTGQPHLVRPLLNQLPGRERALPALRARVHSVLAAQSVRLGRLTEAVDRYRGAMEAASEQSDGLTAVGIAEELAGLCTALGRISEARGEFEQAASLRQVSTEGCARGRMTIGLALLEAITRGGAEQVALLGRLTATVDVLPPAVLSRLALVEAQWGLWDDAHAHVQAALEQARAAGDGAVLAGCLLPAARLQSLEGRFRESLRAARDALQYARKAAHRPLVGEAYGVLGGLHRLMGSPGRARIALAWSLGVARETGIQGMMSHAQRELALVCMQTGRHEPVAQLLEGARQSADRSSLWWEQVQSEGAFALYALSQRQPRRAVAAARRALTAAERAECPVLQGLARGWVAVVDRDHRPREAVWHHFRHGRRVLLDGGFSYHEAMIRLAYGEWLLARDSRRAHPVVREAREDLADMGALGAYLDPLVWRAPRGDVDDASLTRTLTQQLSQAPDADGVVTACLSAAVAATGAERGFLIFREPEGGTDLMAAIDMNGDPIRGEAATLSQGILDRAFRTRQPLASLDARADARFSDRWSVQEYDIRSVLCVPLMEGGDARAALYLDNRFLPELFGAAELRKVESLALQCAPTLFLARRAQRLNDMFTGTIRALAAAVDAKDPYTRGHSRRVSRIAVAIAEEMGLDVESVRLLELASLLHDVGKVGTPDTLLSCRDPLAPDDVEEAREHPLLGAQILSSIPHFQDVVSVVLQHHENLDGTGYPLGLKGEQVGLPARIVAVADALDTITTDRPYRIRLSLEDACREIRRSAGTHFDQLVVDALLRAVERGRIHPGGG